MCEERGMFDIFLRMIKAEEAGRFASEVQKGLIEQKNMEWRSQIRKYVKKHKEAPYIDPTVIVIWTGLSETLRNACFYEEALLIGKLAVSHSVKLQETFVDVRIKALEAYGLAQIESMMLEKGTATLKAAWDLVRPGIPSYEILRFLCGQNLSYAYLKRGKLSERQEILSSIRKWIEENKPSEISNEDLLFIELDIGNGLLYQGRFREGLLFAKELEKKAQAFHLEESSVYYKILMLRALFEKMNNHIALYYGLTKQAILYAKRAGDRQEEYAYLVNLLDAMNRLGKSEEMLSEGYDILQLLDELTENINSLNLLQCCMSILIGLYQYPDAHKELKEITDKAYKAWNALKKQGVDYDSRDMLKFRSQFALIKVCRAEYAEAEAELYSCLADSRRSLGNGDVDTLSIMEILARVRQQKGQYREALDLYLEIEELRKSNGQEETYSCFETMRSIAYMYYAIGEKQKAYERILLFFEKIDRYSYETFLVFDEQAWKAFSYKFMEPLHDLLGWLAVSKGDGIKTEQIYKIVLCFKNRIYDEEVLWKARNRSAYLRPKFKEYYQLLKMPFPFREEEGQVDYIRKKQRLQEEISGYRPDALILYKNLDELKEALGEGEIILDYAVYNKSGKNEGEGYLVFYITRNAIRFYDLGDRQYIDEDMEDFYNAVSFYQCGRDYLEQQLVCVKAGLGLLEILPDQEKIKKIYLCLDGDWMPKMPWHYILADYRIQVLSSLAAFGRKKESRRSLQNSDFRIDFFGNTTLPAANMANEALSIAGSSKVFLKKLAGERLRVYERTEADREAFVSVSSPDILHIAVHGICGMGDGGAIGKNSSVKHLQGNIMLMSSRSSYECLPEDLTEYDGAVTLLDVMQMDLEGTELVVLNSCDTGIGNFKRDEGVYGFPRAFLIAGTEGVLTCLWKVDAVFSVIFTDCFYRNYFACRNMEEALCQSRLQVRKMTVRDIGSWLKERRNDIETMENGEKIYKRMEALICRPQGSEEDRIFDNPAYWACFTLARADFC